MTKSGILLLLLLSLISCGKNDPEAQLKNLNGYWEIENVETPFGKDRAYKFNERIDYIEIQDSTGFRTKVLPRIDGTFVNSETQEKITVRIIEDSLRLNYSTPFAEWTETVLEANDELLKVKNDRGMIYSYKKFEKINITD